MAEIIEFRNESVMKNLMKLTDEGINFIPDRGSIYEQFLRKYGKNIFCDIESDFRAKKYQRKK